MKYDEFLNAVGERGGPADKSHADAATKQILAALGQRLAGWEPYDLASQLPPELQEPLMRRQGQPENTDNFDQFLHRIADREGQGCSSDDALAHSKAVFATMATFVSPGEIEDLRSQLPPGYEPILEAAK